jgi:hypothetical protein
MRRKLGGWSGRRKMGGEIEGIYSVFFFLFSFLCLSTPFIKIKTMKMEG